MIPIEPEKSKEVPLSEVLKEEAPEPAAIQDVEAVKQALAEEKAKAEKYLANWQRSQADLINCRRRCEQEKEELSQFAVCSLLLSILPIIDDLERAVAAIPPDQADQNWTQGVQMVERKCKSILETQGLAPIKAVGEPFDPRFHEAVRLSEGQEGIITEEIRKGYVFRGRVIRPSMVVVGNGVKPEQKEESERV